MIAQSVALFIAAANGLGETSTLIGRLDGLSMQKVGSYQATKLSSRD